MASGGQLQEVQAVYIAQFNTGKIPEALADSIVIGVDDKRSTAHDVATIPVFFVVAVVVVV